jgi:hypothetical protein
MRFHNEHFKNFVNDIVDFDKYNLPHITEICNNSSCKYHHENNIKPYNIFQIPSLRSDDKETQVKMDKLIKKIIYYMDSEIIKYNYLPNNFMFIFPILTKNFFANRLEAKIQEFWMEKFNDENYQNNVLVNNKYWEKRINKKKAYKYIFLHKSDEGKSIDLRESENATRILSIHASKGNGCEVIFVFGLNQKALQIFSKDKCNLQYDSLLHVALTRQKKSLYIGIENINDDIAQKFEKYIEIDNELKPDLNDIKKSIKYNKIIDFSCNSDNLFLNIYDKYLSSTELVNILPDNQDNKNIIEWGHHIIRYCVFYYYLKFNIINNEKIDDEHIDETNNSFRLFQFTEVLNKISKLKLKFELHNKYYKKINYICDDNTFYILEFTTKNLTKYNNYKDTLFNFIKNIQEKISKSIKEKKIPFLCPLETVILLHMIKLYDDGKYSDITIMDVYSIIYYFDECSNSIDENHSNEYKCLCKKHFNENNNSDDFNKYQEIRESIINHYMKTEQIKILYENYKKYITEKLSTSKFKYNIFHPVVLYNDHSNFKITNNFELIANSDEYIIDFIITPQFNKLNFNNIMLKSIFNNFLLQNIYNKHKNNLERYANKIIYTCILSLDSNEPIFIKDVFIINSFN